MLMSNFDECVTNLTSAINQLKTERANTYSVLIKTDKDVNHCYHIIELLPLNAAELSKVTKKLKELLILRRVTKEKIAQLDSMFNSVVRDVKVTDKKAIDREQKYKAEALEMYKVIFGATKGDKAVT